MTEGPRVSVIVASHERPEALRLCLTALGFQDYRPFEVIVAADAAGLAAIRALPLHDRIKTVCVDDPGVAAARNAGLALAAGEIVAFIDDDAVAEATWLGHLVAPFADPRVAAAGGFVRGRNGISFQWRARWVDACGHHYPLEAPGDAVSLHKGAPGRAIRTEGTNMAVRRTLLADLGGFDPGYRYFLDETDLNLRLARAGALTAIAPLAQVHHGFAPSARRRADRAPRSLQEIGASSARFLRKFCPEAARQGALDALRAGQRRGLVVHMVEGRLEPRDVARLMATLEQGIAEGQAAPLAPLPPLAPDPPPFRPAIEAAPKPQLCLAGRGWWRGRLRRRAARLAAAGHPVTLFLFTHTARYHRMRFLAPGIWVQSGGLFGRSDRRGPVLRLWRFGSRVAAERARLAPVRPLDPASRVARRPR